MTVMTNARNASLADLAVLLRDQHARQIDVVARATSIRSVGGLLYIEGADPVVDDDGVTRANGVYRPTSVCDEGLAEKLKIPLPYLRRLRNERVDLLDANLNGWLRGRREPRPVNDTGPVQMLFEPDARSFLVRCFRGDDGGEGIARAFLSDQYKVVNNLDVLTAALRGVERAGVRVEIESCDLTERRMTVRLVAPEIRALAPILMAGYRNPFNSPDVERAITHGWDADRAREAAVLEGLDFEPDDDPVVYAGFVLSNSETGDGAFSLTPRLVVKVCRNGLTITKDALRSVHLGGRLAEGLIRWSDQTQALSVELVTAKTADAVRTFLDKDYMTAVLAGIEEQAGVKIKNPADDVKTISKKLEFDEATTDSVLSHFILGGQMTAAGLVNAISSVAQTIGDADRGNKVEAAALKALELAAAL